MTWTKLEPQLKSTKKNLYKFIDLINNAEKLEKRILFYRSNVKVKISSRD